MRGVHVCLLTVLALAGCDSLSKPKVDNPVMGPAPPRISFNNDDAIQEENPLKLAQAEDEVPALEGDPPVTQTSLTEDSNLSLSGAETVAIVNGSPILASEVLERYGTQLAEAKKKLPPDKYQEARMMLIKQDLHGHIERKILAEGLKNMLKKEQIEMLNNFINQAFDKEVARMMKEAGVNSKLELDEELHKQHTSLANLKTNFANQRMAMEFLGTKTQSEIEPGRPELLAYYNEHHESFYIPARVKWQQILVNFNKHGGRDGAQKRLDEIIAKMRPTRGANFTEVATELSDGPTATNGGRWEWTTKGSVADKRVDQALFELPEGLPSQVFESNDSFNIVMVNQRDGGIYRPFDEVQGEIKESMEKDRRKQAARKFIDEMMAKAEITTIFDESKSKTAKDEEEDEMPLRFQ